MKYVMSAILAATLTFFLFGCAGDSKTETTEQHETPATTGETTATEDHLQDEATETIELDNGEKWKVNDEMKPFVFKGQELVSGYLQNQETDYTVLAKEVKEQNDLLIKSCTMKGKSHDELHKWLHPHLELVKELGETNDPDKAKELVAQLQKSYKEYGDYFQ